MGNFGFRKRSKTRYILFVDVKDYGNHIHKIPKRFHFSHQALLDTAS